MAETKKKNVKKTTPKKKVVEDKKEVVNKPKKKKTNKKKLDSLLILKIVFCLLVVLVVVLGCIVAKQKADHKDDIKANIVIPIVDKEDEAPFSINLRALNEAKEYVLKVTNYQGSKINNTNLNYYIDVLNETDTKVSLTRYGSNENLLSNESTTTIDCGLVPKEAKSETYYVIKMLEAGSLGKDDLVKIKVRATK